MCLHLSGWDFNKKILLHCSTILKSSCSISWSFLFVIALNILMSSANRNVLDLVKSGRSFTYRTNNKVPKTDPCGIPDVTLCQFNYFPFTATFCRLFVMNASIQLTKSFLMLKLFNLLISLVCGTVSKAFSKSI